MWGYRIESGVTLYFDNEDTKWSSVQLRIWGDGWNHDIDFTQLDGSNIWAHRFDGGYDFAGFKFHEAVEGWGANNSSVNDIVANIYADVFFNGQSIDIIPTNRSSYDVYVLGFGDWNVSDSKKVNANGTVTVSLAANTEYQFKIRTINPNYPNDDAWFGNVGTMNIENCSGWNFRAGNNDCHITTTIAGDYTFHVTWGNGGKNWYPTLAVDYPGQEITITTAGYATYYNSKKAYTLPQALEGYVAYVDNGIFHFEKAFDGGEVVPANEALVLKGAAGQYPLLFVEGGTAAAQNDLLGTDVSTELEADNNAYFYGFTKGKVGTENEGKVGFYWMNSTGEAFTNGAHKAYLKVAKSVAQAPAQYLLEDEVTAVENVEAVEAVKFFQNGVLYIQKNGRVYNAMGQLIK